MLELPVLILHSLLPILSLAICAVKHMTRDGSPQPLQIPSLIQLHSLAEQLFLKHPYFHVRNTSTESPALKPQKRMSLKYGGEPHREYTLPLQRHALK